jgi:hypothetical protein
MIVVFNFFGVVILYNYANLPLEGIICKGLTSTIVLFNSQCVERFLNAT